MLKFHSKIEAIETYLPKNFYLVKKFKKENKDWDVNKIISKTGIKKVWYSSKNETALDLAYKAGKKLVKKIDKSTIDTLIFVTQSPDYFLPTSACILQNKLKLNQDVKCFDINLGCSGFIYALSIAAAYIETDISKRTLIICSDTYTKFINKRDRSTRPLFSDAASATQLSKSKNKKVSSFILGTDGSGHKDLIVKHGGARTNFQSSEKPKLFMNGPNLFMFTISSIPRNILKLLKKSKLTTGQIKKFFFHQASKIILENLSRKMNINENKMYCNLNNIGNTVSSSIPFALKQAHNEKKISRNDLLVLSGFGVGLSWGSCIIKWDNLI